MARVGAGRDSWRHLVLLLPLLLFLFLKTVPVQPLMPPWPLLFVVTVLLVLCGGQATITVIPTIATGAVLPAVEGWQ